MKTRQFGLLSAVSLLLPLAFAHNIVDFGALADNDLLYAEQHNANAFNEALVAANFTADDRVVYVPANMTFHTMPIYANYLRNVTIRIDGTIKFSKRHREWSMRSESAYHDCIQFKDGENIRIVGNGTIDGQGYMWWVREWLSLNKHKRPVLLKMQRVRNIEITGVRWLNSPRFNIWL